MISQECQYKETNDQVSNLFQRVWHMVKRFVKRYQEWEAMKQQHRQLLGLSNHMLKDIGISSADAIRLTRGYTFRQFMLESDAEHQNRSKKCRSEVLKN